MDFEPLGDFPCSQELDGRPQGVANSYTKKCPQSTIQQDGARLQIGSFAMEEGHARLD